jgi:hypothetical protein
VDDARKQAAKRGADAVTLEKKEIEEWMTGHAYSHSVYTGTQYRTDVYKPFSKQEKSQGYEVELFQYDPQKAPQFGLDNCYWGACHDREWYERTYWCEKEDIQFFIDQGADIRRSPILWGAACYVCRFESLGLACRGLEELQFIVEKGGLEGARNIESKFDRDRYDQVRKNMKENLDLKKRKSPNEKLAPLNCDKAYLETDWFDKKTGETRRMFVRPLSLGEQFWFLEKIIAILDGKKN